MNQPTRPVKNNPGGSGARRQDLRTGWAPKCTPEQIEYLPLLRQTLWFHFTNWLKDVLTPSSPHLRSHSLHRRRRRFRLPLLRHLPRLALVGGKYRQASRG